MATKAQSADQMSARLAHLNMIQAIISRLATFSANAKNFCITIEAAILGVAFQQGLPLLVFAALFVLFAFGALDVYYLAQERRFREFYRDVQKRPIGDADQLALEPRKLTAGQYLSGIRSFSTGGFYLLLLIGTAVLLSIGHGGQNGVGKTGGAAVRSDVSATESKPVRKPERVGVSAERPVQNTAAVAAEGRDVRQPVPAVNSNR
jgi:hypothetical protein